jgi:zinc transport system substrate-binding protein
MRTSRIITLLALTGLLVSCGDSPESTPAPKADRLTVAASFYPVAEIVQRVGGDDIELLALTAPGIEPHDSELSAKQLDALSQADIVFYIGGGFQPDLEKAVASLPKTTVAVDLLKSVDVITSEKKEKDDHGDDHAEEESDGHDHGHSDTDPHVWLDPANMVKMSAIVSQEIAKVQTELASDLISRQTEYANQLTEVGTLMDSTFASCERKELVSAHDAFTYFTKRANLIAVPISGVDPENEPSAKELEAVAKIAQDRNVTTVFFEEVLPKAFADTVAKAIGASVDSINAVETISQSDLDAGVTYSSIMQSNITKIATALGCK